MKILLTGATGYIGKRLLPILIERGHHVVCCVRDLNRFNPPKSLINFLDIIQVDFLDKESLRNIPVDIDAAYYLIHSMSGTLDYHQLEQDSATNFKEAINKTSAKQVIYLSGIVNEHELSSHLESRKNVEDILSGNQFALTALRAGIIIGSGSASFEIIRDLVEKLPLMIAPKWLRTKCQPIGIRDVVKFLEKSLLKEEVFNRNFDIGGSDILSYKEMLLTFGKFRKLNRKIFIVPVMTPKLSSYWLYFVTSISYKLAASLVDSMKIEVICRDESINEILNVEPEGYEKAISRAFKKIEDNDIVSSWKDSQVSGVREYLYSDFINVPTHGCFKDFRALNVDNVESATNKLWRIGGNSGWYYGDFLWSLRGFIDQLFGGVGLRRGRTNTDKLHSGDALDFWRVLYANKEEGRLLLFAEMKLPGEAWLEFKFKDGTIEQTATFRPNGVLGRIYWFSVLPFHGFIFNGMITEIAKGNDKHFKNAASQ